MSHVLKGPFIPSLFTGTSHQLGRFPEGQEGSSKWTSNPLHSHWAKFCQVLLPGHSQNQQTLICGFIYNGAKSAVEIGSEYGVHYWTISEGSSAISLFSCYPTTDSPAHSAFSYTVVYVFTTVYSELQLCRTHTWTLWPIIRTALIQRPGPRILWAGTKINTA